MSAIAISDRDVVKLAVIEGNLSVDYLTDEDIFEMEWNIFEAVADKLTVFSDWETLQ